MGSSFMGDIGAMLGATGATQPKYSTSRKGNTELNMEDFLSLMIVQLQSQTIDDTMDTSEMMNQMVQMQMVEAITNMTETSLMGYTNSLVGKVVTVGVMQDNVLEEREILVMGTGTYNGQQVIFGSDGNMYYLNQIMASGYLPDEEGKYSPGAIQDMLQRAGWLQNSGSSGGTDGTEDPSDDGDGNVEGTPGAGDVEDPDNSGNVDGSSGSTGTDETPESGDAAGNEYTGDQGAPGVTDD